MKHAGPLTGYKTIRQSLQRYHDLYTEEKKHAGRPDPQEAVELAEVEKYYKDKKEANRKKIARVEAYMTRAKANAFLLLPSQEPKPFDNNALAKLSVQIRKEKNDPFAEQLYTEAHAQWEYLRMQDLSYMEEEKEAAFKIKDKYRGRDQGVEDLKLKIQDYFTSQEMISHTTATNMVRDVYCGVRPRTDLISYAGNLTLGEVMLPLPVPQEFRDSLGRICRGHYVSASSIIAVPVRVELDKGDVILAEYDLEQEQHVLSGIQRFLINVARYYSDIFGKTYFFDPVRYGPGGLECLGQLCGGRKAFIDSVPASADALQSKVRTIIASLNQQVQSPKQGEEHKKNIYIFHNFPQGYDHATVNLIQQLCVNAEYYGVTVILTHNIASQGVLLSDVMGLIRASSFTVGNRSFTIPESGVAAPFHWYQAPEELPQDVADAWLNNAEGDHLDSNEYQVRAGIPDLPEYTKGYRAISDIPFGIGADGEVKNLNFEGSDFATFICGASRSGKSTMLHTLITGFLKNNHPDDIELWLVDFNMTEFSRYIGHLPPHVRYIILDKSPELVYDIIDRLTEIMLKRQSIFKGKWQKLSDVPGEKYMPSIMVVIDEFSAMSQIVSDSVLNSKENYVVKLQNLLSMGAKFGLHFIFSSQGFTSGTRGLNDFSKKQIQQRIAMKTEYAEIKDTMDLKSATDDDRRMMEHLPQYHALTRRQTEGEGNNLEMSKVLYISDYEKQEKMIDNMRETFYPVERYDLHDKFGYIYKKPLIVDGNSYNAFSSRDAEMGDYLRSREMMLADGSEHVVFLGEPKRMMPVYPVHISNEFCENMLIIAPQSEKMAVCSAVLSMMDSLAMQGCDMEVWATRKNPVYQQLKFGCQKPLRDKVTLDDICQQIAQLKSAIERRVEDNRFIFIAGAEALLAEMSYQTQSAPVNAGGFVGSGHIETVEKRNQNEPDLLSQMAAILRGEAPVPSTTVAVSNPSQSFMGDMNMAYDAREDLKFILTNGPRLGYHIIMQFGTAGDFGQNKLNASLFKHKVLFRMTKNEAVSLAVSSDAAVLADLDDHSFRYTDGLDGVSFRPYLHQGLSWDGWQLNNGRAELTENEEEDYLL